MTNNPATRLATATERADIIALACRGESCARIARTLNVPLNTVRDTCKFAAMDIRANTQELVAVRHREHDQLMQRLIERLRSDLLSRDGGFCKDRLTCLIKLLERQSRLLGLDASRTAALGADEWLADKSDGELVDLLRSRYGITDIPHDILAPSRN